jgi:hypothetical protein
MSRLFIASPFTVLLLLFAISSCGGRSAPSGDGQISADTLPILDRTSSPKKDKTRGDGCIRPEDQCKDSNDCPQGWTCDGCYPDPCCPECERCYGRCTPKTCRSSTECGPGQFCEFGKDCGRIVAGTCQKKPTECPEGGPPACGCDSKVYFGECAANAAGSSVTGMGACDPNLCSPIGEEYNKALEQAKLCCLQCATPQCTRKIKNSLFCPCMTYVQEPSDGLKQMEAIEAQWNDMGCLLVGFPCPAITCEEPQGSGCVNTSGLPGPRCIDYYAD